MLAEACFLSLSRLWSRSRSDEARRLLGGVLQTFSEGHDTADLRGASEQMARLAQISGNLRAFQVSAAKFQVFRPEFKALGSSI